MTVFDGQVRDEVRRRGWPRGARVDRSTACPCQAPAKGEVVRTRGEPSQRDQTLSSLKSAAVSGAGVPAPPSPEPFLVW